MIRKILFKMSLFILALGFAFVLASCGGKDEPKNEDKIAPLIEINPATVELFAGDKARNYDPMTGVVGRDDVDGTITNKIKVDKGNFNPDVPGEYTFTYTLEDTAGNKSTKTRTVIVLDIQAAFKVGDAYTTNFVVNPQLRPQYVGGSFGFDLTKVQIFSKDYIEWALENYPERLATLWGALVIIDEDGMVVHSRYLWVNVGYDEEGVMVNYTADTLTWTNYPDHASSDPKLYKYRPITAGGMFGDILKFIPDGGHVLLGVNGFYNEAGSPKKFFEDHIVNISDNGLGKIIDITTIDTTFDENDTWPIIKVPYQEVDLDKSTARTETKVTLSPGDEFDIMDGITAKSAKGADITNLVSTKIYAYSTMKYTLVSVPGVSKEIEDGSVYFTGDELEAIDVSPMNYGDATRTYVVEYTVTDPDNGKTDTSWRVYEVVAPKEPIKPSQITYGTTTEEVIFNDTTALLDRYGSGINMRLDSYNSEKIYVYSRRGYLAAINDEAVIAAQTLNGGLPILPWGIVVVVDKDGKVVQYRDWTKVLDGEGNDITAQNPKVVINSNGDKNGQLSGLEDIIPVDGFVIIFPPTAGNAIRLKGLKIFINPEITASNDLVTARTVDWTQPVVKVEPNVEEIVSAFYGREEKTIHFNNVNSLKSNGTNVNMRFANDGIFFVYTKEGYLAALADEDLIASNDYNQGLPYLPYGAVALLNADGTIAYFRVDAVGQYDQTGKLTPYTEVGFDHQMLPSGSGGLLANLNSYIPDNGYVVIFPFTGANDQKKIATELLWNSVGDINQAREFDWSKPILKIQEKGQYATPFDVTVIQEEFEETPYNAIIGDKQYHVSVDDEAMWAYDPSGYNFIGRTQAYSHIWHIVTYENRALAAPRAVEWNGLVIVCNPDGTIHHIRIAGNDSNGVATNKTIFVQDGEFVIAGMDHEFWSNGQANSKADSLFRATEVMPEDGFIIVLPGHFKHHLPVYNALMAMTAEEFATHSFLKVEEPEEPEVPTVKIGELAVTYTVNDEAMWAQDAGYSFVGRSVTGNTQFHVVTVDKIAELVADKASNWGGLVVVCNPDGTIDHMRYTNSSTYQHEVTYFEDGVKKTASSDSPLWGNGTSVAPAPINYNTLYNITYNVPEGGFIVVATQHGASLAQNVYNALNALSVEDLVNVFKQVVIE